MPPHPPNEALIASFFLRGEGRGGGFTSLMFFYGCSLTISRNICSFQFHGSSMELRLLILLHTDLNEGKDRSG